MYIVRWLMGHPIIAFFVLGGVAMLLALDSGHMGGITKQGRASIDNAENSTNVAVNDALSTAPDLGLTKNSDTVLVKKDSPINVTTVDSTKATSTLVDKKNEVEMPATSFISEEPKEETANTPESTEVTDLGQSSSEEMLQMAREAYWNNGLDEAAQIYKQLIEQEPKVLEHKGELGNVYWRQGYPKKAAELYSEIAIPMIENGSSDRVANMIKFIELHYPDRAAEIHKKIQLKQ